MIITNEQLRELAVHGSKEFPIQYYLDDTQNYCNQKINRHWHSECEFAVTQEGEIDCLIGDENVHICNGDGIFINTRIIHGFKAQRRSIMPNIVFSPKLISAANVSKSEALHCFREGAHFSCELSDTIPFK